MTIGQLIPYLQKNIPIEPGNGFKENDIVKYQKLKSRYLELENNTAQLWQIINNVPHHICPSEEPYLTDNMDFFIAFTLLSKKDEINITNSGDFINHINNCYWCFSEYSQFIKDIYYATKEIENQQMGVKS